MDIVDIVWLCLFAIFGVVVLIYFIKEKFKECVEEEVRKKTKTLWMENVVLKSENERLQRQKADLKAEIHNLECWQRNAVPREDIAK